MAPDPRQGAFFELGGRTRLRLTGNDRLRFLNGQTTNDISKATSSAAVAACIVNAKGRLNGHVFVSAAEDCLLVDAAPELRETLAARLERYLIADEVEIEDVTDQVSLFHVFARPVPSLAGNCTILSANRFGRPGFDIWGLASQRDQLFNELSRRLPFCDAGCAETFRIEQGIPRWGRELTEEIIPPEANLEESSIDYEKGVLHRPGSDFPDENVRATEQGFIGVDCDSRQRARARNEALSDGRGKEGSWLDHQQH